MSTSSSPHYLLNFFQVSDKRWYWLKTFALATIKDWEALEKFSKERRPPTGKFYSLMIATSLLINH